MNTYLKEQVELRDKQLHDMQDRVKQQEDNVRQAFLEVDQQSKKLKKREVLINQALKRLEVHSVCVCLFVCLI